MLTAILIICVFTCTLLFAVHHDHEETVVAEHCVVCSLIESGRNLTGKTGADTASNMGLLSVVFVTLVVIFGVAVVSGRSLFTLKTKLNN